MKSARKYVCALVTVPNLKTARRLARAILADRLAACVNIVPRVESHYWWRGKLERSAELLLVIKTERRVLPGLEQRVLALHPYETPEFIVSPLAGGNERYLQWLSAALVGAA